MPIVYKVGNTDEFWIRERCFIQEISNTPDVPAFSLAMTRVEPGVTTELHSLSVDEWYILSAGSGMMEVGDDDAVEVGPGDIVEIPAGTAQRITNHGDIDLVFTCVCLPRFSPDCYQSLEAD
jgi:mannose-6-phosphate isomerase-like protein (cupin superfamily)